MFQSKFEEKLYPLSADFMSLHSVQVYCSKTRSQKVTFLASTNRQPKRK